MIVNHNSIFHTSNERSERSNLIIPTFQINFKFSKLKRLPNRNLHSARSKNSITPRSTLQINFNKFERAEWLRNKANKHRIQLVRKKEKEGKKKRKKKRRKISKAPFSQSKSRSTRESFRPLLIDFLSSCRTPYAPIARAHTKRKKQEPFARWLKYS